LQIPVIGLGTWQTFDVDSTREARAPLEQVLAEFATSGGTLVDSSPMYRRSEEVVGDLAARLRLHDALFVATKVWTTGRNEGVAQMESSLRKLQTKTIDLMQVHNLVDVETHLATLREWKAKGRVRHIGVTHYRTEAHEAVQRVLASEPLDFIQINYSAVEFEAERRLLPLAMDRGVAVIANRPLGAGTLLPYLRGKPVPQWAHDIDCQSWAQLLLKFVISHPAITCAIPATSKLEHLRDNMRAGIGTLPDDRFRRRIVDAVKAS
jgi:diketogulonate reductase-like aldo/keto reductase